MPTVLQDTGATRALSTSNKERAHNAIQRKDLEGRRALALASNGLISTEVRRNAWPLLLGLENYQQHKDTPFESHPHPHRDEEQVRLDTERARLFNKELPLGQFKSSLNDMICRFLRNHDGLYYYQGFHDIASVFLTVYWEDQEMAYQTLRMFTLQYLRDFMMPTISASVKIVEIVPELLEKVRPDLALLLIPRNLGPFFCLSPIVTAFAHDIHDIESLCLIFDQIISRSSFGCVIYTYIALLILKHNSILEKITLEDDMFSREDLLHNALSKFLSSVDRDDIDSSLQEGLSIQKSMPLKNLRSHRALGKFSSFKRSITTTRTSTFNKKDRYLGESIIQCQVNECEKLDREPNTKKLIRLFANGGNQQLLTASIAIGIVSVAFVLFNSTQS